MLVQKLAHGYFMSKYYLKKIVNLEDVEDLTQNVLLSFTAQISKIENPEFWLRRVLFLTFVSFYKKSKKVKIFDIDDELRTRKVEFNFGENPDSEKILALVSKMSEEKQQLIKMRFWEDLKFNEIAEIQGKSEDSVKKMFYRLVLELREKLQ